MPLKTVKKDTAEAQTIEWILPVKDYKLTLDKKRCVGCQICSLACPKEAIKTQKQARIEGEKVKKAKVDIDLAKCNFCGICDVTCPYGAIKVTLNGAHDLSILSKESYPQLVRDIKIDSHLCQKECIECEAACPFDLIKISKIGFDGQPVENIETLSLVAKNRVHVNVEINKDYCPTCKLCEVKCVPGGIKVTKIFEGKIDINQEKCPDGCRACFDVCPITGALELKEDGRVHVNETFCTYCGACKVVCPVEDALTLKRTAVHHTPIRSGTWNKALEKLTSTADAAKELRTIAGTNRKSVVAKRFVVEEIVK